VVLIAFGRTNTSVLQALAFVIPAIMILLGVEMLLNLLLGAYRPRLPGELPRPAFDSRSLGLMTSHESLGKIVSEAMNYQFGFEISRSWFYRLLSRSIMPLLIFAVLMLAAASTIVTVGPHQNAVIVNWGRISRTVGPGVYIKPPWPWGKSIKVTVDRVEQVIVATGKKNDELFGAREWTVDRSLNDGNWLLAASGSTIGLDGDSDDENESVGGSVLGAEMSVQYRVRNPEQYLMSSANPRDLLAKLAERRLNEYFASHTVDMLLGPGRLRGGEMLKKRIQQDLDAIGSDGIGNGSGSGDASTEHAGLGLEVVFVGLTAVYPPFYGGTAQMFLRPLEALQEREAKIQDAERQKIVLLTQVAGSVSKAETIGDGILELEGLRNELSQLRDGDDTEKAESLAEAINQKQIELDSLLLSAEGAAAVKLHQAQADRWSHVSGETVDAIVAKAEYKAYSASPAYYRARLYLQTLAEQLAGRRVMIIANAKAEAPDIEFNLEDEGTPLGELLGQ